MDEFAKDMEKMGEEYGFQIDKLDHVRDLTDTKKYEKIELSDFEIGRLNALASDIPTAAAAGAISNMYTITFPKGIQSTLTKLNQGGYSTLLKGADGKFLGTASLYQATPQALLLGAFTALSIATGQFFLSVINKELKEINRKLDEIISLLHEDKKCELFAEIKYVKDVFNNWRYIVGNDALCNAKIVGLQSSQKIALSDMEFYKRLLENTVEQEKNIDEKNLDRIMKIADTLILSHQLYLMSIITEVSYINQVDEGYINSQIDSLKVYSVECKNALSDSFSKIEDRINNGKNKKKEELHKKVKEKKEAINNFDIGKMEVEIKDRMKLMKQSVTYIIQGEQVAREI
jgi:hypothetical protein